MSAALIADTCIAALRKGNKIFFAGNGGSAADAQHLAAELVGKLNFNRPPLAAIALTTDTSIITAIGNDYGFEYIFSRQIEALGKAGDVLIAISTSGNSLNILRAIGVAKKYNITVIGLTGKDGGAMNGKCNILYKADSLNTQIIQEAHIKLGHEFCSTIERKMFAQ
jgi:D-sedoheptulose 7-phosphate isomerase